MVYHPLVPERIDVRHVGRARQGRIEADDLEIGVRFVNSFLFAQFGRSQIKAAFETQPHDGPRLELADIKTIAAAIPHGLAHLMVSVDGSVGIDQGRRRLFPQMCHGFAGRMEQAKETRLELGRRFAVVHHGDHRVELSAEPVVGKIALTAHGHRV